MERACDARTIRRALELLGALGFVALVVATARAQEADVAPELAALRPLVVERGTTTRLVVRGRGLDGATVVLIEGGERPLELTPGPVREAAVPGGLDAGRVGDRELDVELLAPADPGAVELRVLVAAAAGSSRPQRLPLVSRAVDEAEPNDGFHDAGALLRAAAHRGSIGRPRDVDVWSVELLAGERLRLETLASRLGAPTDPLLTVHGPDGAILGSDDDSAGGRDAALEVVAVIDGAHRVVVQDANDRGSELHGYALVVSAAEPPPPARARWEEFPTVDEARELIERLHRFVREHHLRSDEGSPLRGMLYEYRDMRAERPDEVFVQGEALDTMRDGAWYGVAMANAWRATGEDEYLELLADWQLPFYSRMLLGSDELFGASEVHVRPERADVWAAGRRRILEAGEKGFVPYWWDDGGSISLERDPTAPLPPYPCFDALAASGVENPRFRLHGWSLGSSNHVAQDVALLLGMGWLAVRDAASQADDPARGAALESLAAELGHGARELHECRLRHHGAMPACVAAAALTTADDRLLSTLPDPELERLAPDGEAWRCLHDLEPESRHPMPESVDDAQHRWFHGIVRAGGRPPRAVAFRTVLEALTVPLAWRHYCDDTAVEAGMGRFDRRPMSYVGGKPEDYRSDRRGPNGGPRPVGSRVGAQSLVLCGLALQALRVTPEVWEAPWRELEPADLVVRFADPAVREVPDEEAPLWAPLRIGGLDLKLLATRRELLLRGRIAARSATLRIHAAPGGEGSHARLDIDARSGVSARNHAGEPLVTWARVQSTDDGVQFAVELPFTVVRGQRRWANGVEHGRYSVVVGDETRDLRMMSTVEDVQAALHRELGLGLRAWAGIFDRLGYLPTAIGAGRAGPRWRWDDFSDTGAYAHVISAAAQWILYLDGRLDWKAHGYKSRRGAPRSENVLGYISEPLSESEEARAARLAKVAERRRALPVLVHRGATRFAPENTLEAYAWAVDRGADGFEVDIRRSADGVLYVLHDDTLERVTRGAGRVRGLSYFEILAPGLEGASALDGAPNVPTFVAVLEIARRRAALLHLDIKEPGLEEEIAAWLDRLDLWEHVVSINDYNSTTLIARHRDRLLSYKGWFPQEREAIDEATRDRFLARPGSMVFCRHDPAGVLRALGREVGEPRPLPEGLRAPWGPDGEVRPPSSREREGSPR